jgi:hypothetical protein
MPAGFFFIQIKKPSGFIGGKTERLIAADELDGGRAKSKDSGELWEYQLHARDFPGDCDITCAIFDAGQRVWQKVRDR